MYASEAFRMFRTCCHPPSLSPTCPALPFDSWFLIGSLVCRFATLLLPPPSTPKIAIVPPRRHRSRSTGPCVLLTIFFGSPDPVTPWTLLEGSTCSPIEHRHVPQRISNLLVPIPQAIPRSPLRQTHASTLRLRRRRFPPSLPFPSRTVASIPGFVCVDPLRHAVAREGWWWRVVVGPSLSRAHESHARNSCTHTNALQGVANEANRRRRCPTTPPWEKKWRPSPSRRRSTSCCP